jgi:hypothetical protein
MDFKIFRTDERPRILFAALALATICVLGPSTAHATPTWNLWDEPVPPGPVTSVSVGPSDIPFIVADGRVYYLGIGKGACLPGRVRVCANKWIEVPGISASQVFVSEAGQPYALEASTGRVMTANGAKAAPAIWVPGTSWSLISRTFGTACLSAFAISGFNTNLGQAFYTAPADFTDSYSTPVWGLGCDSGDDKSIWSLPLAVNNGVFFQPGWHQVASGQGAATGKVAVFSTNSSVGVVTEIWFQDSTATGGLTWIYNEVRDRVVSVPNPFVLGSAKPVPPRAVGTAITDHYARFMQAGRAKGWIFKWDDAANTWSYVIGDPPTGPIEGLGAYSAYYPSTVATFVPTELWAFDSQGNLYTLNDSVVR